MELSNVKSVSMLATNHNDYFKVSFLSLPREIIIEIVKYVNPLTAMRLVFINREFSNIFPKNLTRQQRIIRFFEKYIYRGKIKLDVCKFNISHNEWLSEDFIIRYSGKLSWSGISRCAKLSEPFLHSCHCREMKWKDLCFNPSLGDNYWDNVVKHNRSHINWMGLAHNPALSESFFNKYISHFSCWQYTNNGDIWRILCENPSLGDNFWKNKLDKINWDGLCKNPSISKEFWKNHVDKIVWSIFIKHSPIAADDTFLDKYYSKYYSKYNNKERKRKIPQKWIDENPFVNINKLNITHDIAYSNPVITEDVMRKLIDHHDNLCSPRDDENPNYSSNWHQISLNPSMSESFWEEYIDHVNWPSICSNKFTNF